MGKPADRVEGVSLVTDYGVLERIQEKKYEKEAKEMAMEAKKVPTTPSIGRCLNKTKYRV